MDTRIDISFGLDIHLSVFEIIRKVLEVVMKNSNVLVTCVLDGVAFLRNPGGYLQPRREIGMC